MICHNCKREHESFELDSGETGYWFCVPKGTDDVEYLLSDLTISFLCSTDEEPLDTDKYDYWCVRCINAMIEENNDGR